MRKIKGTHIPRIVMAVFALVVFFATLYFELISKPVVFTTPLAAGLMVVFLFSGVIMLVASWMIGFDSRAELYITLLMIGLHLIFDSYIFVRVFVLAMSIPVPLVQGVIEAYWFAGLLDVLAMYAVSNWERTKSSYVSPEQQLETMRLEIALLKASKEQADRQLEASNKVYDATCPYCLRVFHGDTQDKADKAMYGHKPHCSGVKLISPNGNGHKQKLEA